jgi:L-amino acid N-acyltransferase YncA
VPGGGGGVAVSRVGENPLIIDGDETRHADGILAILNHAIVHSTALYDYHPRPAASMGPWFATRRAAGAPVLVVEDAAGVTAFATWGPFRPFPAYRHTVEHSLYVRHDVRGRGLGRTLLTALVARAEAASVHMLVGAISADNGPSIRLHEACGFQHAGTVREAGRKFGRWLDLALYQRILAGPTDPAEG